MNPYSLMSQRVRRFCQEANQRPQSVWRGLQQGASVIEMAFVLPVLLSILFAVIEYSIMFGALYCLNSAAAQAARQAALLHAGYSAEDYAADALTDMQTAMPDYIGGFKDAIVYDSEIIDCNGEVCVRLTATYPNYSTNPIVGGYLSSLGLIPAELEGESVVRVAVTPMGV